MIQVSAIIPTYNRRQWVQIAVDSVLRQRGVSVECIVVDDGSTDGTGEALQSKYGDAIRYVFQPNAGVSTARNLGASLASASYLAFLDSDDFWLPEKLRIQLAYFQAHPHASAVYCQAYAMDQHGKPLLRLPYGVHLPGGQFDLAYVLQNGFSLSGSTPVIRKAVFEQVNGYNTRIRHAEDTDILLKLLLSGYSAAIIRRPLAWVRSHAYSKSLSIDPKTILDAYRDHQLVYAAIPTRTNDLAIQQAVRTAQQRQTIKLLAYNVYANNIEAADRLYHSSDLAVPIPSGEYDRQIHFFTPLIYGEKLDARPVIQFAKAIFSFRDRHARDARRAKADAIEILRAAVWCAGQDARHAPFAWAQLAREVRRRPALLLAPGLWKLVARLLFGRLAIRLYLLWSHAHD